MTPAQQLFIRQTWQANRQRAWEVFTRDKNNLLELRGRDPAKFQPLSTYKPSLQPREAKAISRGLYVWDGD